MLLNVGIGVGTYSNFVPLNASFEYGFGKYISAGLQTDFYTYYVGPEHRTYTALPTSVRASYHYGKHFLKTRQLDLYGGLAVGLYSPDHIDYRPNKHPKYFYGSSGGPTLGLYAGVKYLFTPRFGLYAEAGHNISWLKMGFAFRF
tara:strand:- start:1230 stop:1664 length:435 start_codon:yes stop_codon:yes gene_type:complete